MARLKKNLIYQTVYQILAVLLPLITTPIVARALGADGLGQFSYTNAIVSYFGLFILLGVKSYGTRQIAQARTHADPKREVSEVFCQIYALQLALAIGVIALYYLTIRLWAGDNFDLACIQGVNLLSIAIDVSWFYFGIENFKKTVTRDILIKLACMVCIILLIHDRDDLYLYAAILIFSTLLSNLYLLLVIKKEVTFIRPGLKDVSKHLKPNLVLFIPVVAASMYVYMDKIMLGYISGDVQTGYYESMEKIINIPTAFINALMMVMYPRMALLVSQDTNKNYHRYMDVSIWGTGWFSMACTFGLIAIADLFVPFYMGEGFRPAVLTLQIGSLIILPRGIRGLIKSEYLLPNGKDKEVNISIVSGAVVNLVLNLILMPLYGANGAIVATVLSEVVSCGVALWYASSQVSIRHMVGSIIPYALIGAIMYGVILPFRQMTFANRAIQLLVEIGVGAAVYIALSACFIGLAKRRKPDEHE